jgi:hypothetical protein
VAGARRPNRVMALGVALGVVGTLIGRRVEGPTGNATHLYVFILAPTGWGKDYPLWCGNRLMSAVGAQSLPGPGEFVGWGWGRQGRNRMCKKHLMQNTIFLLLTPTPPESKEKCDGFNFSRVQKMQRWLGNLCEKVAKDRKPMPELTKGFEGSCKTCPGFLKLVHCM